MASLQVVEYASRTLVRVLEQHMALALPSSTVTVEMATAAAFENLAKRLTPVITVFLYRISDNPETRNGPRRTRSDGRIVRQPLGVELSYLITPWAPRPSDQPEREIEATQDEQRCLGAIAQALYEHPEIGRSELVDDAGSTVWAPGDSLQIMLDSLPLDDQYRIWDASDLGYRISLTYKVRVVGLDPLKVEQEGRVVQPGFSMGPMGAVS